MSFVPAGFEDSDEDDFDFGDRDYSDFTSKKAPIQTEKPPQKDYSSTASPRTEYDSVAQPSVGRGRGVYRPRGHHTRSRGGGFGAPPSASTGRQHTGSLGFFFSSSKPDFLKLEYDD